VATGNVPLRWNIALSAWVIQDGNYPNFRVGEIVEFAVRFYQGDDVSVRPSAREISSTLLHDVTYEVVSEVFLNSDETAVLDIGSIGHRVQQNHLRKTETHAIGSESMEDHVSAHGGIDQRGFFGCRAAIVDKSGRHQNQDSVAVLFAEMRHHNLQNVEGSG
jgi:hypothetical protein